MKDADAPAVDAQGRPIGVGGQITGFLFAFADRLRVAGSPRPRIRVGHPADDQTIPEMDSSPAACGCCGWSASRAACCSCCSTAYRRWCTSRSSRSGIQFGVRIDPVHPGTASRDAALRDVTKPNSGFLESAPDTPRTVKVPFARTHRASSTCTRSPRR